MARTPTGPRQRRCYDGPQEGHAPAMETRALLITDVVDSTALVQRLGDTAAAALWSEHDRRARALLAPLGGLEIDRSDGFFLLFDGVEAAARFALAYHDAARALGLAARAGLHAGAVILRRNPAPDVARGAKPVEVEGLAKPFAARLMALAAGGQTLLSDAARRALAAPPAGCVVTSRGHYRLKGLDEPVEVFELTPAGAAAGAPPADTDKAYRVVASEGLWLPAREVRHNLAPERNAFVGRQRELREMAAQLAGGCRLLTLAGVGGTGKTRIAQRFALSWLGEWPGGSYFCDLSEARDLEGVQAAVAAALGVPLGRGDLSAQLGNAIVGRGRCLLILDNFEQVVEAAAPALGRWLDRAPRAAFVVTSRERLRLQGETVLAVEPLALADEALELFEVRARARQAGFRLDGTRRAEAARIVELLDGLPLAIELAAARVPLLSPAQIVQRLQDRFALLGTAQGAAARQQTLKATIDWSWALLQPWEQAALAQCAVFEGGFTLAAAEAVLELADWAQAPPVMDVVQALLDKSLLRPWLPKRVPGREPATPCFALYLSVHEYAAAALDARGGRAAAERSHGRHYAQHGLDDAIEALSTHGGTERRGLLSLERENLLAACRRAVQRGDVAVAVATYRAAVEVLSLQGPAALGVALGRQVVALADGDASRHAAACTALARMAWRAGQSAEAATLLEQAAALARSAGDGARELPAMGLAANLLREEGRLPEGADLFEQAVARARETGHRRILGGLLGNLGLLRWEQGRLQDAEACFGEACRLSREAGDRRAEANALGNLATLQREGGHFEAAEAGLLLSGALQRELGDLGGVANNLQNLAVLRDQQGRLADAQALFEQALANYRELGSRTLEGVVRGNLGRVCQRLGEADRAREHFVAAFEIQRDGGQRRFEGAALFNLGNLDFDQDRLDDAERQLGQAAELLGSIGHRHDRALALRDLAKVAIAARRLDLARARLDEAEAELRALGNDYELSIADCIRGRLFAAEGDPEAAAQRLAAASGLAQRLGVRADSELGQALAGLRSALAVGPRT